MRIKIPEPSRPIAAWATVISLAVGVAGLLVTLYFASSTRTKPLSLEGTWAKVRARGRLVVGYIPYFEITSKEAGPGEVRGLLVDVLLEIARDLNIDRDSIVFVETDWQSFGSALAAGKFDLSIAGTFETAERAAAVDFSKPLFYLGNGAVVRVDDPRFNTITSPLDLDRPDVSVAVVMGEQGDEYASANFTRATIRRLASEDLSLAPGEVERGRADVALSDQFILRRYLLSKPTGLRDLFESNPYNVLPICWAVRKNDEEWLEYINASIDRLQSSGWLRRLRANYPMIPFAAEPRAGTGVFQPTAKVNSWSGGFAVLWHRYRGVVSAGILTTFEISAGSLILGTFLGLGLGLLLASDRGGLWWRVAKLLSKGLTYVFLAVPALVLIFIVFYNSFLPFLPAKLAAVIALGMNLAPFAGKIIEAGIRNVPIEQIQAAKMLGYDNWQVVLRFKIPLVIINVGQPMLVQYFTTIKLSSLASVIGVAEILNRTQQMIRETYFTEQAYVLLVLSYVAIVVPIAVLADVVEKRFHR